MTTNKTYWKALEERYFEGLTTKEEERLLRQFLTTEMAQTEDFIRTTPSLQMVLLPLTLRL